MHVLVGELVQISEVGQRDLAQDAGAAAQRDCSEPEYGCGHVPVHPVPVDDTGVAKRTE